MALQTLTPTKDTFLRSSQVSLNFGADVDLIIQKGSLGAKQWMLLEFDLSSVANKVISAVLRLSVSTSDNISINWAVYRLRRLDWIESEATWNDYLLPANWSIAGAEHTVEDRDTSISLTGTLPANTTGWYRFGDIRAHARDAIDNHSGAMAIIVVQTGINSGALWKFHSKENGDSSLIPQLLVSTTKSGFLLYDE
ncbi:MAG: DNRLRE domain-containing protein [Nitrosopumilus sp.]